MTFTRAGDLSTSEQDLTELLDRISAVAHTVEQNPHYDPEGGPE